MDYHTRDYLSPELEHVPTNAEMNEWLRVNVRQYQVRAIDEGCCGHPKMPRDDGRCDYGVRGRCRIHDDVAKFKAAFADWLDAGAPLSLTLNPEDL